LQASRKYIAGIIGGWFAGGAAEESLYALPESGLVGGAVSSVFMVIFLFLWFKADARERQAAVPAGSAILVPLLAVVGVPYYLVRTRRLPVALLHIVLALIVFLACNLAYYGGEQTVYAWLIRRQ